MSFAGVAQPSATVVPPSPGQAAAFSMTTRYEEHQCSAAVRAPRIRRIQDDLRLPVASRHIGGATALCWQCAPCRGHWDGWWWAAGSAAKKADALLRISLARR